MLSNFDPHAKVVPVLRENYTMADLSKELIGTISQPLGMIATIPFFAAAGAMATSAIYVAIPPLSGAIVLANFATIAVCTAIAIELLGGPKILEDKNAYTYATLSTISAIFFTHATTSATFSYLRMPAMAFSNMAMITIGGLAILSIPAYLSYLTIVNYND